MPTGESLHQYDKMVVQASQYVLVQWLMGGHGGTAQETADKSGRHPTAGGKDWWILAADLLLWKPPCTKMILLLALDLSTQFSSTYL